MDYMQNCGIQQEQILREGNEFIVKFIVSEGPVRLKVFIGLKSWEWDLCWS
jgi:hypothetical protein